MQEMQVRSLGREDPLERKRQPTTVFLAWEIPWTVEPRRLQPMGVTRELDMT